MTTTDKIVTPEDARALLSLAERDQIYQPSQTVALLAHTTVVLGEQREVVLDLHSDCETEWVPWCAECNSRYPCPTARAFGVTE